MEKRKFGNTDMEITPIGLGAWAIGGAGWAFGWGKQDDVDSIGAIHKALDLGINWIDTAAVYGLGHSEEIVAKALKGISERPYVFTKCSLVWNDKREISSSLKSDSIRKECESSLKRLQVETLDLYQVHWPTPAEDIEEGWETLSKLKKEGKVKYIGVSNFNVEQIKRAEKISPVRTLQPPYSLVKRDIEQESLPYCKKQNIGVIVYSPMTCGLLSGKMTRERILNLAEDDWRRNAKEFNEPKLSRNLELVEKLKEIGNRYSVSPGEVAISWTLLNSAVNGAIVGARNSGQVEGIIKAGELRLNDEEISELNNFNNRFRKD
jgi:aryl-alcohol dehydrogenase-like predicted oxidoreductase